jgi:hypothetical protein
MIIKDSIVAIGDSFTDYYMSWADQLSEMIKKPLKKFTLPGASNKTILNNFYANWHYEKLEFIDCLAIYQSTHILREDLDVTKGTMGHEFIVGNKLESYIKNNSGKLNSKGMPMPIKTVTVYGREYLLSGFKYTVPHVDQHWPYDPNNTCVESARFLSLQMNILSKALKIGNNKFLMLLGLHNDITADDIDFSEFPIDCEYAAYMKNGRAYGIDQYVLDINQIDATTHPNIEGHKAIVNNILLPKLQELKWLQD